MNGARNDEKLFVVPFELGKRVAAEIAGMSLFAVYDEHRAPDLSRIRQNGHVQKGERGRDVPTAVGIERTEMIAALCLIIIEIIFDEEGSIFGKSVRDPARKALGSGDPAPGKVNVRIVFCEIAARKAVDKDLVKTRAAHPVHPLVHIRAVDVRDLKSIVKKACP